MNISPFIPAILAYAGCLVLICSIPLRAKKMRLAAGNCIMPLRRGNPAKIIGMFIVCLMVISVTFVRKMDFWGISVICAVAVLGTELGVRNFILLKNGGIYENGFYIQHPFIFYENIKAIPALLWEDANLSEKLDYQLIMEDSADVNLFFQSEEEAAAVIKQIVIKNPRLAQK